MGMTSDGRSYWQAESEGLELLDSTIGDLFDTRATALPTQEAVVYSGYPEFGDALSLRWTYRRYRDRANQAARGLMALGLRKGDHIAIWAANVPEWPLLQMAAAKAGLVLVTVNPLLRAAEIEYILKQGDVRALFLMAHIREHNCLQTLRAMTMPGAQTGEVTSERLPHLRHLCLVGAPPAEGELLEHDGWRPLIFSELVGMGMMAVSEQALAERQASVQPHDPAMILYTSGTTGFPKGAVLTHANLVNQAMTVASRLGLEPGSRMCVVVPFFHVFGCVGYTLAGMYLGGTIHPLIAFDPRKALQVISSERCAFSGGVPTMLLALLQHPDFAQYDLSSLKRVVCAGAPVPVTLMEQVKERVGADVVIAFGQTENAGAMTLTLPEDPFELKAATVGKPLPHVEVKIIDPATGEVVPVGERGEVCARGWLVMAGYYHMPERSAEAVDADGWLHTGDLATMNAQGYLRIVGRLKDMVIRGGENLFPAEVEAFLLLHPRVADVAVLGVPDAFFGEVLLAVVLPQAGEELTEEELRAFCAGQISAQKIPRYFTFTDAFPMTASGKIQKFVLREQAIQTLGLADGIIPATATAATTKPADHG